MFDDILGPAKPYTETESVDIGPISKASYEERDYEGQQPRVSMPKVWSTGRQPRKRAWSTAGVN
jgi:hypothetical protein